jgi:hypothetical protein
MNYGSIPHKLVYKKRRLFVCLFVYSRLSNFQLSSGCHHYRWQGCKLDLCLALVDFSNEGSFSCHTYCDIGPQFIRSHQKDRHPRPTEGFEPGTQGSPLRQAGRKENLKKWAIQMYTRWHVQYESFFSSTFTFTYISMKWNLLVKRMVASRERIALILPKYIFKNQIYFFYCIYVSF